MDYSDDDSAGYDSTEDYNDDGKNFTILDEAEIRRRQNEAISHISSLLSLSNDEASILLYHYNWKTEKLHEDWFADEDSVRNKVGLLINNSDGDTDNCNNCEICYDDLNTVKSMSASCGHRYCVTCWESYITVAINNRGAGCLSLQCPAIKCNAAVTRDLIVKLVSDEDVGKYDRYFIRSYVECRVKTTKWCPSPGCDNAVEFEDSGVGGSGGGGGGGGYDVSCVCSHEFCWNCVEEPHRPVDCELLAKWILKNSSEAENTKWILAFSKPCPKCKRPIEKNLGCNHMSCREPCRYQFCWLCLGDWGKHSECNRYAAENNMDEKMRKNAKDSLQRYSHYYERWASNHKSRQKAIEDLQKVQTIDLNRLSDRVNTPTTQLEFIVQAWKQIIECRRILKWTYAYGFYMAEDKKTVQKKELFEFLQGQAEAQLEKLHGCAEIELSGFLVDDVDDNGNNTNNNKNNPDYYSDELEFSMYRSKLSGLTKVAGKHFEELLKALEDGLSEVVVQKRGKKYNTTMNNNKKKKKDSSSSSSYSQPQQLLGQTFEQLRRPFGQPQQHRQQPFEFDDAIDDDDVDVDVDDDDDDDDVNVNVNVNVNVDVWSCDRCTFRNPGSATSCQMCVGN
ncbi:probable E3 ubiquitin-protein ligase ARI5 [Spinacia oleracea]|uniref:RBR-type E3 ubiquitin transferase n=1 Tax=Spinacia oleracea TaxID=3562 RepID=A0A9R0JNX5_SPIOL|nr:probable E3 ubiquitin-protein ligase ARI5 [Spinacia oleracea]